MKRSILASLSILLLSSATAIAVKAESKPWQIKPTVAGPTVFQNSSAAYEASTLSRNQKIKPTVAGPTVFLNSPAAMESVAMQSGAFIAAEHSTTGIAQIVTENGHRYLVLDEAFSTSEQGPDLHVLLEMTDKPPQQYQNFNSYVNLGKLQKYSGTQRYPIPDSINLSNYKSVVIWCRMANATFGYAPLGAAMRAQR